MKSTGIVRKIDYLGRLVLPMELRRVYDIKTGTPIEICTDDNAIVLKKYESSCSFCGNNEDLIEYNHKSICKGCLKKIKAL